MSLNDSITQLINDRVVELKNLPTERFLIGNTRIDMVLLLNTVIIMLCSAAVNTSISRALI